MTHLNDARPEADANLTAPAALLRYRVWDICWDVNPPEPIHELIIDVPDFTSPNDLAYAVQAKCGYLPILAEYERLQDDPAVQA